MERIKNQDARKLWLAATGLLETQTGKPDVAALVTRLGYVQLDTIDMICRAHHHILWSRNQNYRQHHLTPCLNPDRSLFEHFTHDASVLPMQFLPVWKRQFDRHREKLLKSSWYSGMSDQKNREAIFERIRRDGALSTLDFASAHERKGEAWARPPHKLALDFMWHSGDLATCHRRGFTKMYDIAERVYPEALRRQEMADSDRVDWLCRAAIQRLGIATQGEIQRFWHAMSAKETRAWIEAARPVSVAVEGADKSLSQAWTVPDFADNIATLPAPSTRIRLLSPFDPLIRDRARVLRLFGFDYRIEIFVPKAKRRWGYYVYPLLEGTRFTGRIEARADTGNDVLEVMNLWAEHGAKWGAGRMGRLDAELRRIARLAGVKNIIWTGARRALAPP